MNVIKAFLKPNWWKFIILILLADGFFLSVFFEVTILSYIIWVSSSLIILPFSSLIGERIPPSLFVLVYWLIFFVYWYILSCLTYLIIKEVKHYFFPKEFSKFTKKIVLIIIFIISLSLSVLIFVAMEEKQAREHAAGQINARIQAAMTQMQIVAEIIYEEERSYENIKCNYGDIKLLCEDIEKRIGNEPTIHSSTNEYCAYSELKGGGFWCIDSTNEARRTHIYPGEENYCDGKTFQCPKD